MESGERPGREHRGLQGGERECRRAEHGRSGRRRRRRRSYGGGEVERRHSTANDGRLLPSVSVGESVLCSVPSYRTMNEISRIRKVLPSLFFSFVSENTNIIGVSFPHCDLRTSNFSNSVRVNYSYNIPIKKKILITY